MALVKLSGLVSDVQGKVGGSIFQKGQSGHILKNSPNPINRNSELQGKIRVITYNLQNRWRNLTVAQRVEWDLWAKWLKVEQKNISGRFINGQQAYLRTNFYRVFYNETILDNPVFLNYDHDPLTIYLQRFVGFFFVVTDDINLDTTSYLIISVSLKVSPSINNPGNRLKMIYHVLTHSVSQDIQQEYHNIFGMLPGTNDYVFARWSIGDKTTGIVKPFQEQKFQIQ